MHYVVHINNSENWNLKEKQTKICIFKPFVESGTFVRFVFKFKIQIQNKIQPIIHVFVFIKSNLELSSKF